MPSHSKRNRYCELSERQKRRLLSIQDGAGSSYSESHELNKQKCITADMAQNSPALYDLDCISNTSQTSSLSSISANNSNVLFDSDNYSEMQSNESIFFKYGLRR